MNIFNLFGLCWVLTSNPGVAGSPKCQFFSNADLITMEAYVQQEKTIENQFLIYGPKCIFIFGYLRVLAGGDSIIRLGPSCFSVILSPIYMYM